MRIALITLSTPTATNCRAASALPYHLIKYRPSGFEVDVYSFDINRVGDDKVKSSAKELDVKVSIMGMPLWYRWVLKLHLLILRVFLKYPVLRYLSVPNDIYKHIVAENYDAIWIYGEELSYLADKFSGKACVVTTPDCEAMYYYRVLAKRGQFTRFSPLIRYGLMYQKYAKMAEDFPGGSNVIYHLVGEADAKFLSNINPNLQAKFIRHPHYDYSDKKIVKFSQPKVKVLIAGRYDFYMQDRCDEMMNVWLNNSDFANYYSITFLGKDWQGLADKLKQVGYEVNYITFAEDYFEELIRHDIQITPIGVGTGTKGKVLDAFANGLMVIGTERALENIAVVSGESCILYDTEDELKRVLSDIPNHIARYEAIAENGRKVVLDLHGRRRIANEFYSLFKI